MSYLLKLPKCKREAISIEMEHRVLELNGYMCKHCKTKDLPLEFHHIIKIKHGGLNSINNVIPLCRRCHAKADSQSYQDRKYPAIRDRKHLNKEGQGPILLNKYTYDSLLEIKKIGQTFDDLIEELIHLYYTYSKPKIE